MKELAKAMGMALRGREAQNALAAFRAQMRRWRLVMPPVTPLVLDFGLGDFRKTGLIECWIANEKEAGYCGKYLFVFDGQTCPEHKHRQKHETFFVVRGAVNMLYGGRLLKMKKGDVLAVPQGRYHSFSGAGAALLLELSTPCEVSDNHFRNSAIPIGSNFRGGSVHGKANRE